MKGCIVESKHKNNKEVLNDFPFSNFLKQADGRNWRVHLQMSAFDKSEGLNIMHRKQALGRLPENKGKAIPDARLTYLGAEFPASLLYIIEGREPILSVDLAVETVGVIYSVYLSAEKKAED